MHALASVRTAPVRWSASLTSRLSAGDPESGMSTAEYAVGTVAACGFSGVLYKVITSPQVLDLLKNVIARAFKLAF